MTYVQGFVIPVPQDRKQEFIDHAAKADPVFIEHGALRVWECWADEVPHGEHTDFYGAVKAEPGEAIVFSWIEWTDKETCDAMQAKMMSPDFHDDRMDPEKNPMPFDGKRMIYGGFVPVVTLGD